MTADGVRSAILAMLEWSRMRRMRSMPTDVWAMVLVILARSCTGLKNFAR